MCACVCVHAYALGLCVIVHDIKCKFVCAYLCVPVCFSVCVYEFVYTRVLVFVCSCL